MAATSNKRKSKRQEEEEEIPEAMVLMWRIFTKPHFTKAFCQDVEEMGKLSANMILALQGKEYGSNKQ